MKQWMVWEKYEPSTAEIRYGASAKEAVLAWSQRHESSVRERKVCVVSADAPIEFLLTQEKTIKHKAVELAAARGGK